MNNVQAFSLRSDQYARHRPSYPRSLFDHLSGLADQHELAWDCATGNGQAAVASAEFFARLEATDISAEQIRHRLPHPRVAYHVGSAEHAPLAGNVFDAVLVAQAVQWVNLERFYAEALRVLKPNGVLAVWGYGLFEIQPEIDRVIANELFEPIDSFWAEGNRLLMNGYAALPFPLTEIQDRPALVMQVEWDLPQLSAYLRTWSAVKRSAAHFGIDPVARLERALESAWGAPDKVWEVHMPLSLRVGRK